MLGEPAIEAALLSSMASEGERTPDIQEALQEEMMTTVNTTDLTNVKKQKLAALALKPYLDAVERIEGMKQVYKAVGRGNAAKLRLVSSDPNGFRFHPSTIRDLALYFEQCQSGGLIDMRLLLELVAKLTQSSQCPTKEELIDEIWGILSRYCTPVAFSKADISAAVVGLANQINYAPPQLKSKLFLWEIRNVDLLGPELAPLFASLLTRACDSPIQSNQPTDAMDVDITPNPNSEDLKSEKDIIEREAIEKLQKSGKPDKLPKKTPIPSGKPNAKISSFFSVVKRQSISPNEVSTEYFQPFFAKPNQRVAPANLFLTPNDKNNSWKHMQSLPESKAKKKCRCVGVDSEPALLVIKLLKFHENHRPAYFGTWRAKSKEITGRRPMVRSEEVDYEFDSDDDWGEDAEILDAESISGSDCDDDEEDVSELNDEDMEANNWVVPDGYISDDEGLGDHDSNEKRRTAEDRDPTTGKTIRRESTRRYVEKQPIIIGPFLQINHCVPVPNAFESITFTWMVSQNDKEQNDPFSGIDSPQGLEGVGVGEDKMNRRIFTDDLLPDLANMSNGSMLSMAKLFESFSAKHGKISKRQFELKLNQIVNKTKIDGKSCWNIRPEYVHLLPQAQDAVEMAPDHK